MFILNLIHVVNQFVHISEPTLCVLVLKVCSHCKHDMVCPRDISLQKRKKQYKLGCDAIFMNRVISLRIKIVLHIHKK